MQKSWTISHYEIDSREYQYNTPHGRFASLIFWKEQPNLHGALLDCPEGSPHHPLPCLNEAPKEANKTIEMTSRLSYQMSSIQKPRIKVLTQLCTLLFCNSENLSERKLKLHFGYWKCNLQTMPHQHHNKQLMAQNFCSVNNISQYTGFFFCV